MKLEDVKKEVRPEKKSVRINLGCTPSVSKWMKAESISPQKIFDKSVEELMDEHDDSLNKITNRGIK